MNQLKFGIPLPVRRLVCEFMLEGQSNSLLPLEIMEGVHVSKLGIAERVQDWDMYFTVPQPTFTTRFMAAVNILEHAINIVQIQKNTKDLAKCINRDAQSQRIQAIATQLHRLHQISSEQVFYVAGGFVVGCILGFTPWRDIDVWFTPHWNEAQQNWTFITGAPLYPVHIYMVNDPLLYIETSDLDICKCAIKCEYANGKRSYQFILSLSCARALIMKESVTKKIHASICKQFHLGIRLKKYTKRGLMTFENQIHSLTENKTSEYFTNHYKTYAGLNYGLSKMPSQRQTAYWILTIRDNNIASLTFHVGCAIKALQDQSQKDFLKQCKPFILYPCKKGLSQKSYRDVAKCRCKLHWLLRALAGQSKVIIFPGNHRVNSSLLMPIWLLDHAHLNLQDILSLVEATWCKAAETLMYKQYVMCCAFPVYCMVKVTDWVIPCRIGRCNPSWFSEQRSSRQIRNPPMLPPPSISGSAQTMNHTKTPSNQPHIEWYMDVGDQQELRAVMFCSETYSLQSTCTHDREENVKFESK